MHIRTQRLIALAIALLVLVVVPGVYIKLSYKNGYQRTCDNFMNYVITQNAAKSYGMFSDNARNNMTLADWQQQVTEAAPSHYKGKYTLISVNDLTPQPSSTNKKPVPRKELNFVMNNPNMSINVNCYVIKGQAGYQIDGYSYALRSPSGAQG